MPVPKTPRVFVSSTADDLKDFREAVQQALLDSDCHAVMFEYWEGTDNPPLDECLVRMDDCDLVVVVVAKRHDWTPPGQKQGEFKSITRLECERALEQQINIIPFLLDDKAEWPVESTEDHRLTVASQQGKVDEIAALAAEIQRNKASLEDFKQWLCGDNRQRRLFETPGNLRLEINNALNRWRNEHPEFQQAHAVAGFDRAGYRDWLRRQCESVELLGLDQRDAHNVRLQHVYVPAMVVWDDPDQALLKRHKIEVGEDQRRQEPDKARINLPLLHRLACQSLYVPGAPGAGKSTFCRWLALVTASGNVPRHRIPTPEDYIEAILAELEGRIPVLCYLRDLNDHKDLLQGSGRWTRKALEDAFAEWLDRTQPGGLKGSTWRALIENGDCLMILDGVDELQTLYKEGKQSHRPRANFLTGLADALPYWHQQNNRVLLTSRPYGLASAQRRSLGLDIAELQALDGPLQNTFIQRWFAAVDPFQSEQKSAGLIEHLAKRDDLRELRQSPMLLTALCVKYDEGRRLPRDIHILYHSVINQVLHGRYHDTTEQQAVRRRLAAVALGMHTGETMGQARATPEAAVDYPGLERILADYAGEEPASEGGASNAAEKREDLISKSGLLLPRGEERAGFYHVSFQEYLAAERLWALDTDLASYLKKHAATPEWRRTLMFLFCTVAEKRPQAALDATRNILLPGFDMDSVQQDANPALLLLDCLEIAHARGWSITDFTGPLCKLCEQSLESDLSPETRNSLWLSLGKLGADARGGVGLDAECLPDVQWCPVAAGKQTLEGDAGEFVVPAFAIAKHPVTNAQFQAFVEAADGYRSPDWWQQEWLDAGWVHPDTPSASHWTEPNAPREQVTWFEAVAFCRWLDHRLRERGRLDAEHQVRLPTEWEWQQVANGGDVNRTYPWGPDWEPDRLNAESSIGRTTAVGFYPRGQAPCGALDTAGNVWEWCLNKYRQIEDVSTSGKDTRVLRGGSWIFDQDNCRAAYRFGLNPNARFSDIGFRVCLSSPILKH